MRRFIADNPLILMEAAIIEPLRRSCDVQLHDILENAALIYDGTGQQALVNLYQSYMDIAKAANLPFLMCTPTWRANSARVTQSNVCSSVNVDAVQFLQDLRNRPGNQRLSIKIGGLIGCKNDCYQPSQGLSAAEAEDFHGWQIHQLAQSGVDFLIAETLPSMGEAVGIAKAMETSGLPYIISFVINRYGCLLDGTPIIDAVGWIDAHTARNPVGYMVNCSYPTFLLAEQQPTELFSRLVGYRANASSLDHHDLDGADHLASNKVSEWGDAMLALHRNFGIKILGGCCGTGVTHLRFIAEHQQAAP